MLTYIWSQCVYGALGVKGELRNLHGGHASCIHCKVRGESLLLGP